MDSTWGCLIIYFSPFIPPVFALVMLHRQTASDLLCCVFLQRSMGEAQLELLKRDEVIHQVGTQTTALGSD